MDPQHISQLLNLMIEITQNLERMNKNLETLAKHTAPPPRKRDRGLPELDEFGKIKIIQ